MVTKRTTETVIEADESDEDRRVPMFPSVKITDVAKIEVHRVGRDGTKSLIPHDWNPYDLDERVLFQLVGGGTFFISLKDKKGRFIGSGSSQTFVIDGEPKPYRMGPSPSPTGAPSAEASTRTEVEIAPGLRMPVDPMIAMMIAQMNAQRATLEQQQRDAEQRRREDDDRRRAEESARADRELKLELARLEAQREARAEDERRRLDDERRREEAAKRDEERRREDERRREEDRRRDQERFERLMMESARENKEAAQRSIEMVTQTIAAAEKSGARKDPSQDMLLQLLMDGRKKSEAKLEETSKENLKLLRDSLVAQFGGKKSKSDKDEDEKSGGVDWTEVLATAVDSWGPEPVNKVIGMLERLISPSDHREPVRAKVRRDDRPRRAIEREREPEPRYEERIVNPPDEQAVEPEDPPAPVEQHKERPAEQESPAPEAPKPEPVDARIEEPARQAHAADEGDDDADVIPDDDVADEDDDEGAEGEDDEEERDERDEAAQ